LEPDVNVVMGVSVHEQGGVTILVVEGRLDAVTAPDFDLQARELLAAGATTFVIDCGGLENITSAGLQSLLRFAKRVKEAAGAVVLCSLSGVAASVVKVSGFHQVFEICSDREEAIAFLGAK